jgi:hypothetical protein
MSSNCLSRSFYNLSYLILSADTEDYRYGLSLAWICYPTFKQQWRCLVFFWLICNFEHFVNRVFNLLGAFNALQKSSCNLCFCIGIVSTERNLTAALLILIYLRDELDVLKLLVDLWLFFRLLDFLTGYDSKPYKLLIKLTRK